MSGTSKHKREVSRRAFMRAGAAGMAGGLVARYGSVSNARTPEGDTPLPTSGQQPSSDIYCSQNGSPEENVAKVFEMAYGGIENFIGPDDVVVLRPNLQWARNGYTNTEVGFAVMDQILRRPGGFHGEIIVVENQHRPTPHTHYHSGWVTEDKASNGPYNWFELIQYFRDHMDEYPDGVHIDPVTGQTNISFQFLMRGYECVLEDPHPMLPTYSGYRLAGSWERLDPEVDPFLWFKETYADRTCFYVQLWDLQYTSAIARVGPLRAQYRMTYPIVKSLHSGLYVSLYKDHTLAWDPQAESFTQQPVKLINLATLNHHGSYAGVTSVVKSHFGIADPNFHDAGWDGDDPPTFYYAGGAIGYWLDKIRRPDLHMSCAERIGLESRNEHDAYRARTIAISTDPVALDYYVGKHVLFPAGGPWGEGGAYASALDSHDPSLAEGHYARTLQLCHDPMADHSIINGTLDEEQMVVRRHDFASPPGDMDGDGDVDHADYAQFHACQGGPGVPVEEPTCEKALMDDDNDVDLADFAQFLRRYGS